MRRSSPLPAAVAILGAVAATALGGCAEPTTLHVVSCPNPVLLGPVDRVGGHRAAPAKRVGKIDEEVSVSASATSSTQNGVTTTTASASSKEAIAVSHELLVHTEGRANRDVRVKKLPVGAWAYVWRGAAGASQWVGIKADVVEVPRDR